jgi:hypothetical protein
LFVTFPRPSAATLSGAGVRRQRNKHVRPFSTVFPPLLEPLYRPIKFRSGDRSTYERNSGSTYERNGAVGRYGAALDWIPWERNTLWLAS